MPAASVLLSTIGFAMAGSCLVRAGWLFHARMPAAAQVLRTSYTEAQQDRDFGPGIGPYRRGSPGVRWVHEAVAFQDASGTRRRAQLSRWTSRRWKPSSTYVVWYDPARPERVTAMGPGYWFGVALVVALCAGAVLTAPSQLGDDRAQAALAG